MPQLRAEQKLESSHDDQGQSRTLARTELHALQAMLGIVRDANVKAKQASLADCDIVLLHKPNLIWQR